MAFRDHHWNSWLRARGGRNEIRGSFRNIARLPGDTVMVRDSRFPIVTVLDSRGESRARFPVEKQAELRGDALCA